MTTPATTQELIADVLIPYFPDDDDAYTAADALSRDPAITIRPRVVLRGDLHGDWEQVRDALDALPEGAQIRWRTGHPTRIALAIKILNVLGKTRWDATGNDHLITSETIARDNTPIEVIA